MMGKILTEQLKGLLRTGTGDRETASENAGRMGARSHAVVR